MSMVFSTNKCGGHGITEILLKVSLNTKTWTRNYIKTIVKQTNLRNDVMI